MTTKVMLAEGDFPGLDVSLEETQRAAHAMWAEFEKPMLAAGVDLNDPEFAKMKGAIESAFTLGAGWMRAEMLTRHATMAALVLAPEREAN